MKKVKGIKKLLGLTLVVSLLVVGFTSPVAVADPGLVTLDLTEGVAPEDLAYILLGEGVVISNINYTGASNAAGYFFGGTGIIGFENGIILSTGDIADVVGPNTDDTTTTDNGMPGDPDLQSLIPDYDTFDATVLEFDFVPNGDVITFEYVFGSDEYNEWVGSPFNNVFGFFLNGENVAVIPGTDTPVSISNVNGGNPYGTNASNPEYFLNNDLDDREGEEEDMINTELDGLTVVMTVTAYVNPNEINHIKLGVADAGDAVVDSDVFIRQASFSSPQLSLTPILDTNLLYDSHTFTTTLVDGAGEPIEGETVSLDITGANIQSLSAVTDDNGVATFTYTGTIEGQDIAIATSGDETSNIAYKDWVGSSSVSMTITSCDSAGVVKDVFLPGETVYVKGSGFDAAEYKIWIQHDPVGEGHILDTSDDFSGDQELIEVFGDGNIPVTAIWDIPIDAPAIPEDWDIIVDRQDDAANTGKYNAGSDGIDDASLVGFVAPLPELPSGILLGFGLLGITGYWGFSKLRRKQGTR